MSREKQKQNKTSWIESIGSKIPDPVIIFLTLYVIVMILSGIFGGFEFSTVGSDGSDIVYTIKNMFETENVLWIFNNALLTNWLGYAGGILGTILIVMFGIGIAEESGLLTALIKKLGGNFSERLLPYVLVFLGIMSNIATDAGYIILIPLAGLLYLGLKKNPLTGMFAAFAGVSAGFSANLMPGTVVDVIMGTNAQAFAESQGVPFVSHTGVDLNPITMNYWFILASTFLLVFLGGFITNKFVKPKLEKMDYIVPEDMDISNYAVTDTERKGLRWALLGFLISLGICLLLSFGPLAAYVDETGKKVTPFLENIILLITFVFFLSGCFFGFASGKFKKVQDVITGMSKQLGGMGYVLVLTFFSYNFLALLSYTNFGTYVTYIGANALEALGLAKYPILLIIGFILVTAIINLFVGGLTSKWMLLGPIFVPMLYQANSAMTPDVVAAAYRLADSSTNIITPLMTYAGVILVYIKKYKPEFTIGNMISAMLPYSIGFIIAWTGLLLAFIQFGIPLGF